ncbi:thioredoxin family protein [Pseudonocardia yuanmonensis]|uniref:thioredoxin family protein n=1 Tax=Pseudonocardia yuanmonensis TaxID=1095914 RepID=UPI0031EA386B
MSGTGLLVLIAALVVATALGLVLRARAGRVRTGVATGSPDGWALTGSVPEGAEQVLLLQLSSPVCTPCRQTAGVLAELASEEPGVRHVEIDVAERPEVARALSVLRTPTTIGFDRTGRELLRVSGVPRRAELAAALAPELRGRPA